MAHEKIVAIFDKAEQAREAARALEASGFSAVDISVTNRESLDGEIQEPEVWRQLLGRKPRRQECAYYGRTLEAGGAVLTVRLRNNNVAPAMKVLDVKSPVETNEDATTLTTTGPDVGSHTRPSMAKDGVLSHSEGANRLG
jgi:hypothetical protein